MSKVSIIIPSRNERFLQATVNDILEKAVGDIEIIVVIDGGEVFVHRTPDERQIVVLGINFPESRGTRAAINAGVEASNGDYILKTDAHCLFDYGFDEKLAFWCEKDWVVVPRRKRLDAENWRVEETSRPDIDYEYMSWHPTDFGGRGHNIVKWDERNRDLHLRARHIDETMCFQASCYFMHRSYFDFLELMDAKTYGATQNEGEEICFKAWLSGGRVLVNKNTWYAHLYKGTRYPRDYQFPKEDLEQGAAGVRRWLTDSAWHKQTSPFASLIEKFNPPGWPENWQDIAKAGAFNDAFKQHHFRDDHHGRSDPASDEILRVDQPDAASGELSAERSSVGAGRILPDVLQTILGRFNLDPRADYSKVSPVGLRMNRRQLAELFRDLGFRIGAEIGTAEGEFAETLCKANPNLKLFCVDPWEPYPDYRDYREQETLNDLYSKAFARLVPYNVELIRRFSAGASTLFESESLDFVYIDANHKFEYVVADIAAWLPKIRRGGIIAGHDYKHPKGKQFGVIEAVQGWTRAYAIAPWFICKGEYEAVGDNTHSWMWVKE